MKAGDDIETMRSGWKFGGEVAKNFDEHVSKSVPLYKQSHELICGLSEFFIRDNCSYIDIGCSTGKLIECFSEKHQEKSNKSVWLRC